MDLKRTPALIALLALSLTGCATIEPGAVGVKTNVYTGAITDKPLGAGFHCSSS